MFLEPLDLVFVLDCSSSVRRGLEDLKAFVVNFINCLMAGTNHAARVGVVLYAKRVHTLFQLGDPDYSTKAQMIAEINSIEILGGLKTA